MSDKTSIEWTDATWNVVNGCSVISPGCTNCYAMRLAGTRLRKHPSRAGLAKPSKAGPVWTGEVRFNEPVLDQPLRWRRPRRIFVCAHGDLFHDAVPDAWIDRVVAVMARAPHHTFQILTKRAERMRSYFEALPERIREWACESSLDFVRWPLPNVWLGVSAEDQQRADERIPHLLATSAAVRWISAEPLLGPLDVRWAISHPLDIAAGFLQRGHFSPGLERLRRLDWIVAGGESGQSARPMHPDWARSLRDQCKAAGVAFHFKQWGNFSPTDKAGGHRIVFMSAGRASGTTAWPDGSIGHGRAEDRGGAGIELFHLSKHDAGRLLDGVQHDGYPA